MRSEEQNDAVSERERGPERVLLGKRLLVYASIFLIGLLLGFLPMWLKARQQAQELETTRTELLRTQMRSALSAAALDARRGEYEPARKATSDFFTALSSELDRGEESVLDQAQREAVRPLLVQRDQIITLLARSDPAGADRLADLDASYRKALGNAPSPDSAK